MKTTISAERLIGAPPDVIYHCIADYREHHRPDGFLPSAFTDMEIASGGVGAGTKLSWVVETSGRRRTIDATITEPEPGRVLVEDSPEVKTTFTVERQGLGAMVRFDTIIDEGGVQGVLDRLFAARLLEPIYQEELGRLEQYARRHGPLAAEARGAA